MHPSSHTLDRLGVAFDDPHLVANAGLLLPATLAQQLGLRQLIQRQLDLGAAPGRANVGHKAMTVIHALLAGGDSIEDAEVLRAGASQVVLGHAVLAPSTLGTFLRSFTFGHVRQLDAISREALSRAWGAGAGPGDSEFKIDLDSTICETYGVLKQGVGFGYTKVRGYHPLLATGADGGEVLHCRLRGGSANTQRGAAGFLRETFCRVREAGAQGQLVVRADSGFYSGKVVSSCRRQMARFSITARMNPSLQKLIAAIPEESWTPIPYWSSSGTFGLDGAGEPISGADVAEVPYQALGEKGIKLRLLVRRVRPTPGSQLALFTEVSYHPLVTDREGSTVELEADHRAHALVETVIRDLKEGSGLCHLPSGRFAANAAWLAFAALAHNLARWVVRIGLPGHLPARTTTSRLRRQLFSVPGRVTRSARRQVIHLPRNWPWQQLFLTSLTRLHAVT
ncbi:MAG: IS1380 family transposase [Candidatus Dormibacteria bacterium]